MKAVNILVVSESKRRREKKIPKPTNLLQLFILKYVAQVKMKHIGQFILLVLMVLEFFRAFIFTKNFEMFWFCPVQNFIYANFSCLLRKINEY